MAGVDSANPQKNIQLTYDPQVLYGTVAVGGTTSTTFDLSGWTQFSLWVSPNGTITGGTTITALASPTQQGTYYPVTGTSGATALSVQCGSTTNTVIPNITFLTGLRFVQFVLAGTQQSVQTLALIVK